MEYIKSSTILSALKNGPDPYFGITYSMNLYRSCQHQCIYCDSRSECYHIDDFSKIQVKENAIELLHKELKSKRKKGTLGTGSMNDPYMPVEEKEQMVRKAFEVITHHKFPVHVITKSHLVLRDIDLLKEISKTYAAVSLTITAADDKLSKLIEPGAPISSKRFAAVKALADAGIYTGVIITPVLPYITDTKENIMQLVQQAKDAGAKYVLSWMGMTLRDRQRDYYYAQLEKHLPGIKAKYEQEYGDSYSCVVPQADALHRFFNTTSQSLSLPTKMQFYKAPEDGQLSLF